MTHHNVTHLGRRDHICPHEDCNRAFGYKHLLQRHLAKVHSTHTGESDSAEATDEEDEETTPTNKTVQRMDIDTITGMSYTSKANERLTASKALQCPHPYLGALVSMTGSGDLEMAGSSTSRICEYVFSRAYDLRRHLRTEHEVDVEKDKVDEWVKGAKAKARKHGTV
jgi:general transcription factor IIIA